MCRESRIITPNLNLYDGPVGDPAVPRHAVEVEVPVQVVCDPLDLPDHVLMLASGGTRGEAGLRGAAPEVVHSDITIIQANNYLDRSTEKSIEGTEGIRYHIRMTRMNIERDYARACLTNVLWIGGIF